MNVLTTQLNNDYRKGNWVGIATEDENCTDPEALFESIVSKPEDFFNYIVYDYFDGSKVTKEFAKSVSSKIRSHIDTAEYGRCFTYKPTEDMIKSGIKKITFSLLKNSAIFFHSNGMFETMLNSDITKFFAASSKAFSLNLDFTVYKILDIGGKPCKTEAGFDRDTCTESKLDKKSLEKFGCTTPFGLNKKKICKDQENSSKVLELYVKTMKENVNKCSMPCLFESTKVTKTNEWGGKGFVHISCKEHIEVKEAYYLYSMLSMIAEVGGYVGLFLGVSVNQVSALINVALDKFDLLINRK